MKILRFITTKLAVFGLIFALFSGGIKLHAPFNARAEFVEVTGGVALSEYTEFWNGYRHDLFSPGENLGGSGSPENGIPIINGVSEYTPSAYPDVTIKTENVSNFAGTEDNSGENRYPFGDIFFQKDATFSIIIGSGTWDFLLEMRPHSRFEESLLVSIKSNTVYSLYEIWDEAYSVETYENPDLFGDTVVYTVANPVGSRFDTFVWGIDLTTVDEETPKYTHIIYGINTRDYVFTPYSNKLINYQNKFIYAKGITNNVTGTGDPLVPAWYIEYKTEQGVPYDPTYKFGLNTAKIDDNTSYFGGYDTITINGVGSGDNIPPYYHAFEIITTVGVSELRIRSGNWSSQTGQFTPDLTYTVEMPTDYFTFSLNNPDSAYIDGRLYFNSPFIGNALSYYATPIINVETVEGEPGNGGGEPGETPGQTEQEQAEENASNFGNVAAQILFWADWGLIGIITKIFNGILNLQLGRSFFDTRIIQGVGSQIAVAVYRVVRNIVEFVTNVVGAVVDFVENIIETVGQGGGVALTIAIIAGVALLLYFIFGRNRR